MNHIFVYPSICWQTLRLLLPFSCFAQCCITMNKASGGDGIPVELSQILKDDAVKVLHWICQQIWKTQQWTQDWKRSVFIPIPKKGNAKECSNYHKIALSSHASEICSKFSKSGFSNTWTMNFQMFKMVLEKAEEPEIKLPTSTGSPKKQESSRKTSISALLTMPKPLTVQITINWKILKEVGILEHLTCLLRNLYAGQEATVRTGHRNNTLVPNHERSTSRLYIVTLFI